MTSEMLLADQYLRVVQSRGERTLPLNRVYPWTIRWTAGELRTAGKRSAGKLARSVWGAAVGNTGHGVRWPPTPLLIFGQSRPISGFANHKKP